jgi:hypothetical protein
MFSLARALFSPGSAEDRSSLFVWFIDSMARSDYAGPTVHSRLAWPPCCLPPTRNEVGILIYGLFAAQSPRPPTTLSTLRATPRDVTCKTEGQHGVAVSFLVGLFHSQQHAGLSRRTLVNARTTGSVQNHLSRNLRGVTGTR